MEPAADRADVDLNRPNVARVYDYLLGGAHNFAVDRELADQLIATRPEAKQWARANRHFLMRAVRYCAEQGIRQFLDLGSGIPTADHVHITARAIAPQARVAYVDVEPVAVAHSLEILDGVDGVTITQADARDVASVLTAPTVTRVLDFTQPVAVLAIWLVHFFTAVDDPRAIMAAYRDALVPGSYLAISHGSADYDDPAIGDAIRRTAEVYQVSTTPGHLRTRAEIREFFGGHPLVEPGLVDMARWRSGDPDAPELGSYAAVAHLVR